MSLFTGLTHYWRLDETSGNRVDSVGTTPLIESIPSVLSISGKLNRAAKGDELVANALYASADVDISQPRTIAFWAKLNSIPADTYLAVSTPADSPRIRVDTFGDVILSSPDTGDLMAVAFGALALWHLVILKMESNIWSLSIDGSLFQSSTFQAPTGDSLYILGAGAGLFYGGQDEVAVWNRALSQAEADQLWNNGAGHFYGDTFPGESAISLALQKPTAKIVTLL